MPRRKSLRVEVNGKTVPVPFIYPPFYPNEKVCWTPEPDPHDTKRYFVWGCRHFGAEWCRQRMLMLKKRNIYTFIDENYRMKQEELRGIENAVEGRHFPGGMRGAVWKHVWQQINAAQNHVTPPSDHPSSKSSDKDGDSRLEMDMLGKKRNPLNQLTRPL